MGLNYLEHFRICMLVMDILDTFNYYLSYILVNKMNNLLKMYG